MKKLFYILGIAFLSYQCATDNILPDNDAVNEIELQPQTRSIEKSMQRINDSLFIIENGERYVVEPSIITVKFKSGIKKATYELNEIRSNRLGYIDVKVPEGVDVEDYVAKLKKSGEFESVEYNTWGKYCYFPTDARINEQWYLDRIAARYAWDITAGTSSVKVFVLDSGVDVNHPDLGAGSDGYSNIDTSLA